MDLYSDHMSKVQEKMRAGSNDCLLLDPTPNMFYFTGLQTSPDERLQLLIIPAGGKLSAVLPEMYLEKAKAQLGGRFELFAWSDDQDPYKLAAARAVINNAGYGTFSLSIGSVTVSAWRCTKPLTWLKETGSRLIAEQHLRSNRGFTCQGNSG